MGNDNHFYLGKFYDLKKKEITNDRLTYDPPDLTTHMIVTGMTGSGKTGLCVGLLEEAALQGIPALIIDPKGDLTNLALTFPDLAPADFRPWIDKNSARRENKTVDQLAEDTAALWKNGLNDWGLGKAQIENLKNSVERTIYTPGSTTGVPVNILSSFSAPEMDWEENEEILREKISSTVTAILTLVGMKDIDPLLSREHILLANIIEQHWQNNHSLGMTELIKEIQTPPFDQLGAFSLDDFFPKKDRMRLAILLNNVLASPTFQSWIEGPPLDIESMLYTSNGKPKHAIFYLAHLEDAERMFFITLVYAAIETWMRKQRGTGDLRALVYFDEIHGYLPPVANPPSKPLIIRLLKTARAFGVGLVLTTQNPVDVDYKALSNAGTWMVGRLQTDQDKQRLLDGLDSAAGGIQRSDFDRLISALGKRVFLYHNVNENKPEVFHTRWAMSYLAGPLTLTQIPELNTLLGNHTPQSEKVNKEKGAVTAPIRSSTGKSTLMENMIPGTVAQFFLLDEEKPKNVILTPQLIAIANIRYLRQSPPVDHERTLISLIEIPQESGQDWERGSGVVTSEKDITTSIPKKEKFGSVPEFMKKNVWWESQRRDFEHWIYETDTVSIRTSKSLKISVGPEVSEDKFKDQWKKVAEIKAQEVPKKLETQYASKIKTAKDKIERQIMKVDKYKGQLNSRRADTALKVGESLFKLVAKGKITGVSSSSSKLRMSAEAKARMEEAETMLKSYQEDLEYLQQELTDKKAELLESWLDYEKDITELKISPTKQNIRISSFGVLWRN